jgi:hypothetical protein
MKIGGPQGPPPTATPSEEPARTTSTEGARFSEVLAPAASPLASVDASALEEVGARLRAGEVTAAQATEMVIEAVVRAKVSATAPLLAERLRDTLRRMVAEDPVLAAKVRKIVEGEK